MNRQIYVTIDHLDDFSLMPGIRTDDILTLRKDVDDPYDDEAIAAYDKNGCRIGYVANSVGAVARGTYSAGRLYDLMSDETECRVTFIVRDGLIALTDIEGTEEEVRI